MEELAAVYGRSLFEAASDADKVDLVREQLGQFVDALASDQDMQVFFFSPSFTAEQKKDGLHKAVTDADPLVQNFLELLIENHRMPVLMRIRDEYERLWAEEHKLLPVQITSAVELDDKTVQQIGDRIGEQTGRKVELSSNVDPDVLGGLVVRVGNTVLDASIRHRLEQLRKQVARSA
ncbi:MAG: F-type H+-transporting ATPase subunit delta [Solirubrobacteraceae bacterium]|nr:F-type H+-transporting ATPase subunit delta [Solirubrobacteraceae bacterium]